MGTGVVAFNIAPQRAILSDINPHLINFYTALAKKKITPGIVKKYLIQEGSKLQKNGAPYYYEVRDRFNKDGDPLDFLFLNRAGFNGMIRFNGKGKYNIPFCHKPERFSQAYITKIVNQVNFVAKLLVLKDFSFICQSFEDTIKMGNAGDIIYCDPPYIGRHVDYYNGWNDQDETVLFKLLSNSPSRFILSTWHHNDYRENEYIKTLWNRFPLLTREHFYHVGAKEKNRNPMIEAIITNFSLNFFDSYEPTKPKQLALLENKSIY